MACPKCGNEHVAPHDGYYEPHASSPKILKDVTLHSVSLIPEDQMIENSGYVMDIGYLSLPIETQEAIEQAYAEKHANDES